MARDTRLGFDVMSTHFTLLQTHSQSCSNTHLVVDVLNVLEGGEEEGLQALGVLLRVGV